MHEQRYISCLRDDGREMKDLSPFKYGSCEGTGSADAR
jgi:hypothetical protein